MISHFSIYKVKIRSTEFTTEEGIKFSNTAYISFFDDNKKVINYVELGYRDNEEIYKLIDENQEINLNNCYIENFSLTSYRKSRNLEKNQYIKLHGFIAVNSFFDTSYDIDFSYADFCGENVLFNDSLFANGKITFNSAKFDNSKVDFSHVVFRNGNVDFSNSVFGEGELSFKNAIFSTGNKDFQYADFGKGKVVFINTDFGDGDVSFINTNFNDGDVSFKVAIFGKGIKDFRFSKFGNGEISFERTNWGNGNVDFGKVEFGCGKINFYRSDFGDGEVNFEGSEYANGKINFKKANFGTGKKDFELLEFADSEIIFDNADFGSGIVSFYNSKFHKLSLKGCHLDNYFDLRISHCSYLDISDTVVRDIVDLKSHDFKVDIKLINLTAMRLLGRIYVDWDKNNIKSTIDYQTKTTKRNKAEQFRILKQNFNSTGQYNDEDKAYVEFKRNEAKADLYDALDKNKKNKYWAYPQFWFQKLVFDKVGLYATDPLRVLLSSIFVIFGFALTYVLIELLGLGKTQSSVGNPDQISMAFQSLYHSSITFFTIGYGDVYPMGLSRLFSGIEGFMGVFSMSYFTVAFVRKILR